MLINRLKGGDEGAFRILYDQHYNKIYNFIFSFIKQRELTEEILQETFLAIWVQRENLNTEMPVEPLLFTISRRKVLDSFRKITSTDVLKQQLMSSLTELNNETEETVLYNDLLHFTNEAIESLPSQQKAVFKLSRIDGLSYDEIAEKLNLSKNTVRNHLVAALKTLRIHFDNQGILYLFLFFFVH
jgi:RNA polymerase sigma-70 factor (family 1)